ncbi:hypothetical protein LTR22_004115 [Elasticomyces elasticus]|nr:hypothetical protein LTR22_004115 [Elasticomyces elasticus]
MYTTLATASTLIALAVAATQGPPASVTSQYASQWASQASAAGWPTDTSAWSSYASDYASWTSAAGLSSWPTATSEWGSLTSSHPLPSALSSVFSQWATQTTGPPTWPSGWNNAGDFNDTNPGGPFRGPGGVGWAGGNGAGPFGGQNGNGWGPWASQSTGSWTAGPWTSWWGTEGCPASTWSGWTSATDAPWTSWAGCTASTTATSVVTTTVTTGGSTSVVTSTGFGIQIAQATNTASGSASSTTSGSGAMATNFKLAGSAAGVIGVVAGALLILLDMKTAGGVYDHIMLRH